MNHASRVRHFADLAWASMDRHDVLPTPRNFELWYASLDGSNPELTRRLLALSAEQSSPSEEALEALHAECFTSGPDADALAEGSDAMQAATQDVLSQVMGNGDALRAYGAALSHWSVRMRQDRTVDGLARAVATLMAETARASERNRVLEQQLAASSARIAQLKDSLAEVQHEATTDGLTGLRNRKAFDARLRKAASRAGADLRPISLLLIDVDHFKRFNDTHGHQVGDLVLRLVGHLLANKVKERDTAARYGGEEFAVLLEDADLQVALGVAERIRAELGNKRLVTKSTAQEVGDITVSIGVIQLRLGEVASSSVARADDALYRAKRLGRNRVCVEDASE